MSDDKRKTLRDLLDELDRSFEEMEREIEEAVRHGFESGRKVFARPFVAGISMGMVQRESRRFSYSAATRFLAKVSGRRFTNR